MELTVYGTQAICASCTQAPPSKATAEWLEAALSRKYGKQIVVRYVDLYRPETERDRRFCTRILAEEFFYPLLVAGEDVLAEGLISLKPVRLYLEKHGLFPIC